MSDISGIFNKIVQVNCVTVVPAFTVTALVVKCDLSLELKGVAYRTSGSGRSKKDAKYSATAYMLAEFRNTNMFVIEQAFDLKNGEIAQQQLADFILHLDSILALMPPRESTVKVIGENPNDDVSKEVPTAAPMDVPTVAPKDVLTAAPMEVSTVASMDVSTVASISADVPMDVSADILISASTDISNALSGLNNSGSLQPCTTDSAMPLEKCPICDDRDCSLFYGLVEIKKLTEGNYSYVLPHAKQQGDFRYELKAGEMEIKRLGDVSGAHNALQWAVEALLPGLRVEAFKKKIADHRLPAVAGRQDFTILCQKALKSDKAADFLKDAETLKLLRAVVGNTASFAFKEFAVVEGRKPFCALFFFDVEETPKDMALSPHCKHTFCGEGVTLEHAKHAAAKAAFELMGAFVTTKNRGRNRSRGGFK